MKSEKFPTLLSIFGAILTTASVVASFFQYRAADLQAEAAVVALMPQLEVRALLEKVGSDKFTDRRIEISSDGGPVHNLRVEHITWIEFHVDRKIVLQEALNGYYVMAYPTGRTKGALYTLKGYKNNEIYASFFDWRRAALPPAVEVSEPVTLIRLEYRDALKRNNVDFVEVKGGDETHLPPEEGLLRWNSKPQRILDPHMLDINDLQSEERAAAWVKAWRPILEKAVRGG